MSTISVSRNNVLHMESLLPKQLGNIVLDVARHGNSDIVVWKTFVKCCHAKVESLDRKDTLRVFRGVGVFYRNYNYHLQQLDKEFLAKLIGQVHVVCNGYTCDELSQLSEDVSNFAVANADLLDITALLFSKIAVLFNLRLAEATPYSVVRLLVAFSRIGISDGQLFDSLATFICDNDGFTTHDIRTVLTSYALVEHRNLQLLEHATLHFTSLSDLGINDLAILSFVYSTLDYRTENVKSLFQRYLGSIDMLTEPPALPGEGFVVDLPSFFQFLDSIGVSIPPSMISSIKIDQLNRDDFVKVVHLLPTNPDCQRKVMNKYMCYDSELTLQEHVKVLKYVVKGGFGIKEFFDRACSNIAVKGRDYTEEHCDAHDVERAEYLNDQDGVEAKQRDCGPSENPKEIGPLHQMVTLLLQSPAVWVSSCSELYDFLCQLTPGRVWLTDYVILMSKGLVDRNKQLEEHLEAVARHYGTDLMHILGSELSKRGDYRSPMIMRAEFEHYLKDKAIIPCMIGDLTLVALLKDHNTAVLPLNPDDFVCLAGQQLDAREAWSPPGCLARAEPYANIYYIYRHSVRVSPVVCSLLPDITDGGQDVLDRLLSMSF